MFSNFQQQGFMPEKLSLIAVHYYLLSYNPLNASHKFSLSCHGEQKYAFKNAQFAEGLAESHVSGLSHMSCVQQRIRDGQSTQQEGFKRSSFDKVAQLFGDVLD